MTPGEHGPRPLFIDLDDVFVFVGDDLSMEVTAVNTVRTDIITLSATSLPNGATFPPATGPNRVSSTLDWLNPLEGEYTVNFNAKGLSGTRSQSIQITVSNTTQIDRYFYGWAPDTIVKLANGQFWRNIGGVGETVSRLLAPDVTINYVFGQRRMVVEDVPSDTTVEQMDIAESDLDSSFSGLHHDNTYELSDGTIWKQISFENIPTTVSPARVWRWIENGDTFLRFLDRYDIVIGTCEVIATDPPSGGPIVSRIDGWFRGWLNHRVFVLENGQFWQQITASSSIDTLYKPNVTITNFLGTGTWRLTVEGATLPAYVEVQQRTDITRTAIDGMFYGFGSGEFFHLQNGSWWRQTSLDSSASTRSSPEILIWSDSGTDTIEMPDEGRTVSAEQLAVLSESSLIDPFRGLRYATIYFQENGQDWIQISFENTSSDAVSPTSMVWSENGNTHLLVRNQADRKIGTCEVVDPWSDSDGDNVRNVDEMISGTSLLDRNDFFYIWSILPDNAGRPTLRWPPVAGRTYTIEWTPSLFQAFQTLETLTDWLQDSWIDTVNPPGSGGFYRIRVELAD